MSMILTIGDVSQRSGFAAPTLRYYEGLGLLPPPDRTAAGYRSYDEKVLDRLAFIARAKLIGCTLEEIAELMPAWEGGECQPVQDRLRSVASTKLAETQARTAELVAFAAELEQVVRTLGSYTPQGGCDADCGCVSEAPPVRGRSISTPAPLLPKPLEGTEPAIVCTLDASAIPDRLGDWQDLLTHVRHRSPIEGGLRLQLDEATSVPELAGLVASEQSCCGFFSFAILTDRRGVALEVRAPAEAQAIVHSLFGAAS